MIVLLTVTGVLCLIFGFVAYDVVCAWFCTFRLLLCLCGFHAWIALVCGLACLLGLMLAICFVFVSILCF